MKLTLPIILLAACSFSTTAAPLPAKSNQHSLHQSMYNAILQQQNTGAFANKTTGVQRRLIANSYTVNGTLTDTNHYYYSNSRGSTHTDVSSYFDEYYITAIDPVHNILCDSSTNSHLFSSGWYKTGTRSYNYDANNRITKMLSQSYSYLTSYIPAYNAGGKFEMITMADTMATTVATKPTSRMYIFYDNQNRRVFDSTVNLKTNMPSGKREYIYSTSGNRLQFNSYEYDAGSWVLTYRNVNSYDISNRLKTSTAEIDFGMGAGLELTNKDSFAYTGTNTQPSYHIDYNWDSGNSNWQNKELILSQYNTAGLLDTYYIIRFTTQWDTIERNVYIYDTNNLLLRSNGYMYAGNGSFATTPYDQSIMYYENYFPIGINSTSADNTISIYPNPASDIITIESAAKSGNTIQITNMQGQLVYKKDNMQNASNTISIKHLAPGNYIIGLLNPEGVSIAQKQFIKQ